MRGSPCLLAVESTIIRNREKKIRWQFYVGNYHNAGEVPLALFPRRTDSPVTLVWCPLFSGPLRTPSPHFPRSLASGPRRALFAKVRGHGDGSDDDDDRGWGALRLPWRWWVRSWKCTAMQSVLVCLTWLLASALAVYTLFKCVAILNFIHWIHEATYEHVTIEEQTWPSTSKAVALPIWLHN